MGDSLIRIQDRQGDAVDRFDWAMLFSGRAAGRGGSDAGPDVPAFAPADRAADLVDWDAESFVFESPDFDPASEGDIRLRLRPRAPFDSEPWMQDLVPALGALEGEYENGPPAGPDHDLAAAIVVGLSPWGDPFWG